MSTNYQCNVANEVGERAQKVDSSNGVDCMETTV